MLFKSITASFMLQSLAWGATTQLHSRQDNSSNPAPFNYADLSLREVGARNTLEWRVWLENKGKPISFWHDVPLWPDESDKQVINMVVEIPRWQDGKIEIRRQEPLNPIFHDDRKDAPRFVESVWPHRSYPFIYGSAPQTWESPNFKHNFTGFEGDNDPVDVFDIGVDMGYIGQVKAVKVLGGLALNDGHETDWKMLAIDVNDPLAPLVNSWEDIEKYRPGLTSTFYDWFTYYKVPRGDDVIPIIDSGYQGVDHMKAMLEASHGFWAALIRGAVDTGKINYNQTSFPDIPQSYVKSCYATKKLGLPSGSNVLPAAERPEKYDWWYYLDDEFQLIELPDV